MKKRRLIPVLCAAAVAVSLAGCSGSSGSATEKGADTQAPKAEAGAETGKEEDGLSLIHIFDRIHLFDRATQVSLGYPEQLRAAREPYILQKGASKKGENGHGFAHQYQYV